MSEVEHRQKTQDTVTNDESLCESTDPYPCGPCQKLAQMDEEIQRIKRVLLGLQEERQKLKEQALAKHSHEPFIHRLPTEIIADVFMLIISGIATGFHVGGRSNQTAYFPVALSTVCVRWRSIAHSTPRLWKDLNLVFIPGYSKPPRFPPIFLIKEWLDRTGELPLSINFCAHLELRDLRLCTQDDTIVGDHIIRIINVLKEFSNRWQRLIYTGPHQLLSQFSTDENLPQLRTLRITGHSGDLGARPILRLRPERLLTLSITKAMLSAIEFGWEHITHLTLEGVLPTECVEAIRKAPRLKRFTFRHSRSAVQSESEFSFPEAPIMHPVIQHIEFMEDAVSYRILQHLTCPSLKVLVLEGESYTTATVFDLPLVLQFLRRSECSLEQLSLLKLEGYDMFSPDSDTTTMSVTTFYVAIPTVQRLHLSFTFWTLDDFLEPLTEFSPAFGIERPRYLPSLCSLALENDTFRDWNLLPEVFGIRRTAYSDPMERRRRLLQSVTISVTSMLISNHIQASFRNADEETFKAILWLKDSVGVNWDLRDRYRDTNLISSAINDWYSLKLPFAFYRELDGRRF